MQSTHLSMKPSIPQQLTGPWITSSSYSDSLKLEQAVSACSYVCMCLFVCVRVCVHVNMCCLCVCACKYVYICVYVHVSILSM